MFTEPTKTLQHLPIDDLLPDVVASLRRAHNLVIEAAPGAGKTTRVPTALLDHRVASGKEVWVLEPRRLATRLAAQRVADELKEKIGETVGYQVRFEEVCSARTRLRFLTEGVLTRRLLRDPQLTSVGAVVLDEFHERHLQTDVALALLRRLQQNARPDLRLVVMSATLDAAPVARFLGDCPVLRSEGRRFAVEVEYLSRADERPLASQVEAAVRRLVAGGLDGDVLVFLPGAAEIGRAAEACAGVAREHHLLVLPLHGELPIVGQDQAVRQADKRKIILSTNVAETSVTINGVVAVIDSGLARVAEHSSWSGLPRLAVARISRASATQRAGRAGRTQAGRALRLYTEQDFALRQEHTAPEVARLDLASTALELRAAGVTDIDRFEWFESPPANALRHADTLLHRLGALDVNGTMTTTGKRMLRLPLHPRLARLVVEAESRGVFDEGCAIAALIGERDVRVRRVFANREERLRANSGNSGNSDLLELLDLFTEAERAGFAPERLREMSLDPHATRAADRVRRQLKRICARGLTEHKNATKLTASARETELLISVLAGYPDRVARRRSTPNDARKSNAELLLARGGIAELSPESVVRQAELLVAVDAQERDRPGARGVKTVVRLASAIEPEWLLDLFAEDLRETTEVVWNEDAERVETVRRLMYEGLVLDENRANEIGGEEAARVLATAALAAGIETFDAREEVTRLLARVRLFAETFPEKHIRVLDEEDVRASLGALCEGKCSLAELCGAVRAGKLLDILRGKLDGETRWLLATMTPERVAVADGRHARINYEEGKPPWIASRLQDFFGMRAAPKVCGGRIPLVLHLLAPNNRPVQVTIDLAGFWERHYPSLRRELSRRYPRHDWRENPLAITRESAGGKQ